MASILTYNQIIDIFDSFRTRSYVLNDFYVGRKWDFTNNNEYTYPLLQVYIESAEMPISPTGEYPVINMSMKCKILDWQGQNDGAVQRSQSDTLQLCQDLVNEFNQHPYYINSQAQITNNVRILPVEEHTTDNLVGHEFNLDFRLINN